MSTVVRRLDVRLSSRFSRARPRAAAPALLLAVALASGACDDTSVGTFGIASPSLAVVSSDYTTASVSLFNPSTGRHVDSCVTSRSTLKQPLSGDVALPSQAQVSGELTLIDSGNAVLTFVTPSTCEARGQLSVSTGGFKAYPHDVVTVAPNKAYVTRNGKNLAATPDPADFDEGDDLLIVDPKQLAVIGRIPLADFATPGPAPASAPTQARPDHAIFAGGLVYVSLNSISGDFATVGMGRVVIIDPASDAVVGTIDLPSLRNCSGLTYASTTKRLYVACGGAFGDPAAQIAESALVEVDVSSGSPVLGRVLPASTLGTGALNLFYAAVSGEASFAGTLGTFPDTTTGAPGTSDVFFYAPLTPGVAPTKLAEGAAGELGTAVVDPGSNRVFLPDANATKPRVHVYDATTGAPLPAADFEPNPSAHLPPRSVGWY